jgi:hypothetical protein
MLYDAIVPAEVLKLRAIYRIVLHEFTANALSDGYPWDDVSVI